MRRMLAVREELECFMAIAADFDISDPAMPVIAVALHDGHALRDELVPLFAISDADRLREEDPFTGRWTRICGNRIVVRTSRFEVDLNRPRDEAVYTVAEDAWGLRVWKETPQQAIVDRSLAAYDGFYNTLHGIFSAMRERWGKFFVFDLHAYNYRRAGPDGPPADPEGNPEVNIGTGMMDRARWAGVVDRFIADLRRADVLGRRLDVRENVKFYGKNLAQWTHANFPESGCVLAVEFKKFFMDEWSGQCDEKQAGAIAAALKFTIPGILDTLGHNPQSGK